MRGRGGWSPVLSALFAYATSFALSFVATSAMVLGVGAFRAHGDSALVERETVAFVYSASGLIVGALVHSVVLAAMLLVVVVRRGGAAEPDTVDLRLARGDTSPLAFLAASVGLVAVNLACGAIRECLGVSSGEVMSAVARAFEKPSAALLACELAGVGIAPALAEETFFRGLIQGWLRRAWGPWPAIVATAVAFGLIHGDRVQGPVAAITGLWLGWMAERFDTVRPGIVAHASNNALFLLLAAHGLGATTPGVRTWVFVGAAVALGGSIYVVRCVTPIHYAPRRLARYS